ncbi:MAG TPA: phenylacetate--CoA ligase, partial [Bdellovibrionales bacterium]|nr:phenylacetate--CoA ligase [Bdellovibrionales bacterium]
MKPVHEFIRDVHQRVPGYQKFLREHDIRDPSDHPFEKIPLQTKQNYLLKHPIEDLCWNGAIGNCHLIGSSSGFSKSGSVFWPKRPEDEKNYLYSIEKMLV